jgi:hypothetical protein
VSQLTSRYDLRGRQAIMDFWALADWRSVLRKKRHGAPVIQEPDGTWVASAAELDAWSAGKKQKTVPTGQENFTSP